jgi:succinate-semialdehyde dehydrogenase / glutarate-semialdehyde dehydrogenase
MGKPITDAEAEVNKAIRFCKYYSENYAPILPQRVQGDGKKHVLVKYLPLGTIYYLIPFNYPFYLNFKGGLPNLLLGNVILARNADTCPSIGRIIEECMIKAGFGNGEYQNVFTQASQIDHIFARDSVCGVSFTGSSSGGALIAEKAGKYLKRAVMELGGNDPFIVLDDGDVNQAVTLALAGRCSNAGQVCFSPKRFIIHKNHYDNFRTKLIEALSQIKFGDPMLRDTRMGPLARDDLHDNLTRQLKDLPKSYKITWQRTEMTKPFFPITVIEGSDEPWDEELFGPIFQLFRIENDEHAIKIANSGTYGLGGSVFSATRGEEVIDRVRCGLGFVNDIPKSEPTFPSGGVARSGFGRECGV